MAALQPLLERTTGEFVRLVEADVGRTVFPELMTTEESLNEYARELGRQLLQAYADTRLRQAKDARPLCRCGKPLPLHENSSWPHGGLLGEIQVHDVYGYCPKCKESGRPLHEWIGTGVERWSLPVQEAAVDLASDESCQKAVAKLERHHPGVEMGRSTALRLLHEHGEHAREFVAEKLAAAVAAAAQEGRAPGVVELEVEYDGGMIPVATLEAIPLLEGQEPERTPVRNLPKRHKECRWEEAKLGVVQVPGQVEGRLYSVRPTGEVNEAFDDLLALACMKGWSEQTRVRGLADGARHIRPRMEDVFHASPFKFILDRPHAKEHLHAAGTALERLGGAAAAEWAEHALDRLERDAAVEVVTELRAAAAQHRHDELRREADSVDALRLEADYFERNHDAVAYAEYRQQGWSTASSEVESGHRSVVQVRVKLSGTWWHPDNVPKILALRMVKANGWWQEYWEQQRTRWRERARTSRLAKVH